MHETNLEQQTLLFLKSAFVHYHSVHRQATREFVDATLYTQHLEEYLTKLRKYIPYLDSDVAKSFCITKLECPEYRTIVYTIRLKGARFSAITKLIYRASEKQIEFWI